MTGQVACPLVLLAGVPGAGKTEALKTIRRQAPSIRISDPETVRSTLHHWAPWLPYSLCLPFVHITAHLGVLFKILHRGGGPLIVHDPGTRPGRSGRPSS
ncbi:zeta toxin family protein, partial [Dietzia cinnamea]|nr:zeta toxin family protein [Dietzia cinnamea]MCT2222346.1 zeta toxin family protein [Dietzia cinnamea]